MSLIHPVSVPVTRAQAPVTAAPVTQSARPQAARPQAADSLETEPHPETPDDPGKIDSIDLSKPGPRGTTLAAGPSAQGVPGKPAVISIPSPNQSARSHAIDTLVIHHTSSAATAQQIGGFFSQPSAKVSAHYTVGKDGTIVQSVDDAKSAWHAGVSEFKGQRNVNDFSIGIEICNTGDANDPYPDAQYKALGKLVAYLMAEHGLKWERVTGHKDIARPVGRKDDPSVGFSYERLRQEVAAAQAEANTPPAEGFWDRAKRALRRFFTEA